jgi:magnesium chelatase subunit H
VQQQAAAVELAAAEPAWTAQETDARIAHIRERLLELEYSLIPTGLHVVGEPMTPDARTEMLIEMARSGRPEVDLPSMGETVLAGHGDKRTDDSRGSAVEAIVRAAVQTLVEKGDLRAAQSAGRAQAKEQGLRINNDKQFDQHLELLAGYDVSLREDREVEGILRALDMRYVEPAPGGDLLRNPQVLPSGRNIYGFDPYRVPSAAAMLEGRTRAEQLLGKHQQETGEFPETVAVVLWGIGASLNFPIGFSAAADDPRHAALVEMVVDNGDPHAPSLPAQSPMGLMKWNPQISNPRR